MSINGAPPIDLVSRLRDARRLPSPAARRAIRLAAGATQFDIAQELGVDRVTVTRYETGEREPRGARRLRYVHVLDELRLLIDIDHPTTSDAPVGSGGVANASDRALGDVSQV